MTHYDTAQVQLLWEGSFNDMYNKYALMRRWCEARQLQHSFVWADTGKYLPVYIIMDSVAAVAFKFTFGLP